MKDKTNLIVDKKELLGFECVYALDFDGVFSENYFSVGASMMSWIDPRLKGFTDDYPQYFSRINDSLPAMRADILYGIQIDSLQKIVHLCEDTNGVIVIVSSWVNNDSTAVAFQALIDYLFPSETRGNVIIGSTNGVSGPSRETAFFNWIDCHIEEPVELIAIDDSAEIFFPKMTEMNRVINVNSRNGFVTDDYILATSKLGKTCSTWTGIASRLKETKAPVASLDALWEKVKSATK